MTTASTTQQKRLRVSPSTVVIPLDNQELLCALAKAAAELQAGNRSMQNLVVPLVKEAKRRNIIPPGYEKNFDLNWIYA